MATKTVTKASVGSINLPSVAAYALIESQLMAGAIDALARSMLEKWPSADCVQLCEAVLACTQRLGWAVDTAVEHFGPEVRHA